MNNSQIVGFQQQAKGMVTNIVPLPQILAACSKRQREEHALASAERFAVTDSARS
jgi:hypothetical protein